MCRRCQQQALGRSRAGDWVPFFRCRSGVEVCALSLHDIPGSLVSKAELSLCWYDCSQNSLSLITDLAEHQDS